MEIIIIAWIYSNNSFLFGKKVLAEIFFASETVRNVFCNDGIQVDNIRIQDFPSLLRSSHVCRIKLSNLPFIPEDQLSSGIFNLLAPYGITLEGGIFQDHG